MTSARTNRARAITAALLALSGCVGDLDAGPRGGAGGRDPVVTPEEPIEELPDVCVGTDDPGPAPFRRLTRDEYDNTVRDLLGDTTRPGRAFPPDESLGGFGAGTAVSLLQAELYRDAAESLAATAVADMDALLPCRPAAVGQAACARELIETLGARAYRRPLEAAEVEALVALYAASRPLDGFASAIELVVTAILQSPQFLYRVELGAVGASTDVVALTDHEVATRLSYLLWNSMPDEALFAAASTGALAEPSGVEDEARRMLEDPRARGATRNFFTQYLGLADIDDVGRDETLYPEWSPAIARSMRREALAFVEHVVFEGDARFETLFTGSFSFVDESLAGLYGVSGVTGTEMVRVELDPDRRAGLLTMPAFLAVQSNPNQSSPIYRGKFVRERIFCTELPSPPDGLVVAAPDPDPTLTTRERFAQHRTDASCSGCHELMDPIGFGFESYDAMGMFRESEGGLPIDDRGDIFGTLDANGSFDGAVDLAHRVAESTEARDCFATQWVRYGLGRHETEADACTLAEVHQAFEDSDGDVLEAIVAITRSDAFRYRRAAAYEEESR